MVTLIGFLGVSAILIAFVMNLFKKWNVTDSTYLHFNLIGCIATTVYCTIIESYPMLLLQVVWGVFTLIKIIQKNRTV